MEADNGLVSAAFGRWGRSPHYPLCRAQSDPRKNRPRDLSGNTRTADNRQKAGKIQCDALGGDGAGFHLYQYHLLPDLRGAPEYRNAITAALERNLLCLE